MVKTPFHQGLLIGLLVLLLLGVGGAYHTVAQRIAAPRPPNFIILLGEGQGWNSTSVQIAADQSRKAISAPNFAARWRRCGRCATGNRRCHPPARRR
jgi:hypothetical protein